MPERHKGYVAGSNQSASSGQVIWTVRVKDSESPYDGRKFSVASAHGDINLARGLNVDFAVGTVDDEEGKKVMRAVDVRLELPSAKPESESQPKLR